MHTGPTKLHKPKTPNFNIPPVAVKLVASRTDACLTCRIVNKILRSKMLFGFLFPLRFVPIGRLKSWITLSKQYVSHITVNLLFKQHLHVMFGVKPCISTQLSLFEDIPLNPNSCKILAGPLYHRL